MSVNILDLAKEMLGSDTMAQLSGVLGEDQKETEQAFDVASSSILGGLMKQASTTQGAEDLMRHASQFDTSFLDDAGKVVAGQAEQQKASEWTSMGWDLLTRLLGGNLNLDSILQMIAKVTGIGEGSSKSLLSMIAPIIIGLISKQIKSGNLDLSGLINLLMGQRQQVAQYIPADYQQQFGIADFLNEGSEAIRASSDRAAKAAEQGADAGMNWMKALAPVVLLAALAALAWSFFPKSSDDVTKAEVAENPGQIKASDAAVDQAIRDIKSSLSNLAETIAGITDASAAEEAVPEIESTMQEFSKHRLNQFSEAAMTKLESELAPAVEQLGVAVDKARNVQGVSAVIEPALEGLRNTMMYATNLFAPTN